MAAPAVPGVGADHNTAVQYAVFAVPPSFRPDTRLAHPAPTNRNFAHSGLHRGHFVAAADLAADEAADKDSFLLSNVAKARPPAGSGYSFILAGSSATMK